MPVTANTLLTTADYKFMLEDSRVRALIVSEALLPSFEPLLSDLPLLEAVIVSGKDAHGHLHLQATDVPCRGDLRSGANHGPTMLFLACTRRGPPARRRARCTSIRA